MEAISNSLKEIEELWLSENVDVLTDLLKTSSTIECEDHSQELFSKEATDRVEKPTGLYGESLSQCISSCAQLVGSLSCLPGTSPGDSDMLFSSLVTAESELSSLVHTLETRLQFYRSVESISVSLDNFEHIMKNAVSLSDLVHSILIGLEFFSSHPNYTNAGANFRGLQYLLKRACQLIKSAFIQSVDKFVSFIHSDIQAINNPDVFSRCRAFNGSSIESLKPLAFALLNQSFVNDDILNTLEELEDYFVKERTEIWSMMISSHVAWQLDSLVTLSTVCRQTCTQLLELEKEEGQLLSTLFNAKQSGDGIKMESLAKFKSSIGDCLYQVLREKLVVCEDIDELRDVVQTLQLDVLSPLISVASKDESNMSLVIAIRRLHKDAQERLIFKTEIFIRDSIMSEAETPDHLENISVHPSLEKSLVCLAKVYRVIAPSTFQGLANGCLRVCMHSLRVASEAYRDNTDFAEGKLNSLLFLISHFLILREQVSSFECDLVIVEKSFDVTSLSLNLFSALFSSSDASHHNGDRRRSSISTLVDRLVPVAQDIRLDVRRDIEKDLSIFIEKFVDTSVHYITDNLLSVSGQVPNDIIIETKRRVDKLKDRSSLHLQVMKNDNNRETLGISILLNPVRGKVENILYEISDVSLPNTAVAEILERFK